MILRIENIQTLNLNAKIDEEGELILAYDRKPLREHGNAIFDELPKDGEARNNQAEVVIADFTHKGVPHQVFAWEVLTTGELLQWSREGGASRSGVRDDTEANVLVSAISVPKRSDTGSDTAGPPAPGSTQTTVKVKIKKQGSMPF